MRRLSRLLIAFALCSGASVAAQGSASGKTTSATKAAPKAAKKTPGKAAADVAVAAARARAIQIIERYEAAVGGRPAHLKLTTRHIEGTVEIPIEGGTARGAMESWELAPNKILVEMTLPIGASSVVIREACDGTSAWSQTPEGVRDQTGEELAESLRDADFYEDIHIRESYTRLMYAGRTDVGGAAADIVEATAPGGQVEKFYFDVHTGLLVRKDASRMSEGTRETALLYFEDYRDVDGIKFPHLMREESGLVFRIRKIEHNVPVDDGKFAKPGKL